MDVLSYQEHPPFQCSREPRKMRSQANPLTIIIGLLWKKSIFFAGFFCDFTEVNATIDLAPKKKFCFQPVLHIVSSLCGRVVGYIFKFSQPASRWLQYCINCDFADQNLR